MLKKWFFAFITILMSFLIGAAVAYGQTVTPTVTPRAATVTPTPTITVPQGAPATGLGW